MHSLVIILSGLPLGIWAYLLLLHGNFWRERPLPPPEHEPETWPEVVAVIPARDEADVVGQAITGLLGQDYPGRLRVILIDDESSDGTADVARKAAERMSGADRLMIQRMTSRPSGWTGKMWAVHRGVKMAGRLSPTAPYLWLTDADIAHGPGVLRTLVARAEAGGLVLASLMARLRVNNLAEQMLIPAYVFFFQMLYPFSWVNDPSRRMAGAAGGCMLVRRRAIEAAGGIAAIRGQLIDDCALARALKRQGPIWLGLAGDSVSLRGYPGWGSIWMLIARSAFTQLRHSTLLLGVCVMGMGITYLAPPIMAMSADPAVRAFGFMAWATMVFCFLPTLRYYNLTVLWAPLLPLIALFYLAATLDSARRHWLGRGGEWKGRWQARDTA
jgi:hopene-associated glycosyltransferase HpnB